LFIQLLAAAVPAVFAAANGTGGGNNGSTGYVIEAEQPIEAGLEKFLKRAYKEAEEGGAQRIVLVIDTLGGSVISAEDIGDLVRTSKVPTTALVHGRAVSAGTYIALNADELVMEPNSVIGSAAVVDGSGTLITNPKTVAYWTQKMRAAAELNGRDPNLATAMVNPDVTLEIKQLGRTVEKGELLALSAADALKVGYADYTANSVDEVLSHLGIEQPNLVEVKVSTLEQISQFLTQPIVRTLLLIIGIAGVAIELVVPGFGAPGIIGLAGFGLYFFGHYITGFAGMEEVILFVIGVALLITEVFVSSFGILGILGSASLIAGVIMAAPSPKSAVVSLVVALVVAGILVFIIAKRFAHRGVWNKFILSESLTTERGYVSTADKATFLGMQGHSITPLRPAGTALIGDQRVDVVTLGEFIAANTEIKVIRVEGTRVVVQQWNEVN